MRISALINILRSKLETYGDVEVCYLDEYWDKIKRCSHVDVFERNVEEFPERSDWIEERVLVTRFDGGSIPRKSGLAAK